MIKKTERKPGKLKKTELRSWQSQMDIQSDSIFGNQSMGQVIEATNAVKQMHNEYKVAIAEIAALKAANKQQGRTINQLLMFSFFCVGFMVIGGLIYVF